MTIQPGTDLFEESGELSQYRGYVIEDIKRKPDLVELQNGKAIAVGAEAGVDAMSVWRDQVRQTIRFHLLRQAAIKASGHDIKVLSLFFVDRVADYIGQDAPLPPMFDSIFREEWLRAGYGEDDIDVAPWI